MPGPSRLFARLNRKRVDKALLYRLAPKEPRSERVRYTAKMRAFWDMWSGAVKGELGIRHDAKHIPVDMFDELMRSVHLGGFLDTLGARVAGRAEKYMAQVVRIPQKIPGKELVLEQFRERNLKLISNVGAEQVDKLSAAFSRAQSLGQRAEDIATEIQQILDTGEARAALIARDQTLKLSGQFQEIAQTSAGIDEYVWSTSGDERVRPEHAALDGQRFRWDSPPDTGDGANHPGQDYQCRCVPVPVVDLFEGI